MKVQTVHAPQEQPAAVYELLALPGVMEAMRISAAVRSAMRAEDSAAKAKLRAIEALENAVQVIRSNNAAK
jgi:hypothetical protein